jgi:hypothetical protein
MLTGERGFYLVVWNYGLPASPNRPDVSAIHMPRPKFYLDANIVICKLAHFTVIDTNNLGIFVAAEA